MENLSAFMSTCFSSPFPALAKSHVAVNGSSSSLNRSYFISSAPKRPRRPKAYQCSYHTPVQPVASSTPPEEPSSSDFDSMNEWVMALEGLFLEALKTYYQGTPMFTDSEFETLREELEHLGSAHVRLDAMEKLWVQATSARDFDRRVREEFEMSEDDLTALKNKLMMNGTVKRPSFDGDAKNGRNKLPLLRGKFLTDAKKLDADANVDERLKWLLFADATEERFKILLLYLPAVLMSFVTASVLTILFALLDGEMKITVTTAGRFRLGILSYVVVMLTVWFSNQVTPVMLDYLDLGQPSLIRGECPICGAPVSCLFTGAVRTRDERKCSVCTSVVGFNRKHCKVYLVSPPGVKTQQPD